MKKISIALVFMLLMTTGVFASETQDVGLTELDRDTIYEKILAEYLELEEFQNHLANDPDDAYAMLENIVDAEIRELIMPAWQRIEPDVTSAGTVRAQGMSGVNVEPTPPIFKQVDNSSCGPATALMAIYGMKKEGSVTGSTINQKQTTLKGSNYCNTNSDGSLVANVTKTLNGFVPTSGGYLKYNYSNSPSKSQICARIWTSLKNNQAAILHCRTEYLGYYNGHATGHYIAVTLMNAYYYPINGSIENVTFTLADSHPSNTYYGRWSNVPLSQVANSLPSGRYLIAAY